MARRELISIAEELPALAHAIEQSRVVRTWLVILSVFMLSAVVDAQPASRA